MKGAIIVAGGLSQRMGRDKAWLMLDGKTLLERVLATVQPAVDVVVVAARPGQDLPPLGAALRVDDPIDERGTGPLTGVRLGLALLDERGVSAAYLGSVDSPNLSVHHVEFMLGRLGSELEMAAGSVPVVVDEDSGKRIRQPLAAAVRVGPALVAARAMWEARERALFRLFDRLRPLDEVPVDRLPDSQSLVDVDTPDDWARLRRHS